MIRRAILPAVLFLLGVAAFGQDSRKGSRDLPPLPPAPNDHILDEAGLIDDATRAKLSSRITQLKKEVKVDLFIAAYTLIPEGIEERARRLRDEWSSNTRSVVMVYRRGSQELTFSANGDPKTFVPGGELMSIYDVAVAAARVHEDARGRLIAAADSLAISLVRDLSIRDQKRGFLTKEIVILIAALLAAALAIGFISNLVVRRLAQRRARRDTGVYFPEVIVGRRLGAAFGGGTVAELEFNGRSGSGRSASTSD